MTVVVSIAIGMGMVVVVAVGPVSVFMLAGNAVFMGMAVGVAMHVTVLMGMGCAVSVRVFMHMGVFVFMHVIMSAHFAMRVFMNHPILSQIAAAGLAHCINPFVYILPFYNYSAIQLVNNPGMNIYFVCNVFMRRRFLLAHANLINSECHTGSQGGGRHERKGLKTWGR